MKKDKQYLYNMYNATSSENENGELETYENWLERQLITRIERLEELESTPDEEFQKALNLYKESQSAMARGIGGEMHRDNFYCMLKAGRQNCNKCHLKRFQCLSCAMVVERKQEETKRLISGMKSITDWGYFSITISNKKLSDLMYAILITNSNLVSTFHLGLERYSRKQNTGSTVDCVVEYQTKKQLMFEELAGVKLKSSEEFQGEMNVLK